MSYPHRSGRAAFGIAPKPYEAYFPSASPELAASQYLQASPYNAAFQAYDPYEAEIDNLDISTPEGLSGLQRLVGKGKIEPRRANSIIMAQRLLDHDFIRPQAKAEKPKPIPQALSTAYAKSKQQTTDAEKAAWMQKNLNKAEAKATSDDWKKAWHGIMDPRFEVLRGQIAAAKAAGAPVPQEMEDWLNQQSGAAAPVSVQSGGAPAPQAVAAPQSTEAPQGPNKAHIQWLIKNPNLAEAFDQKFGAGSAAQILGK